MTLDPVEPVDAAASMRDVVIIGGAAAGMLVAIHLLRSGWQKLRLAIVEPRARLGEGVAYSTNHPEHLLNVIASRMSALGAARIGQLWESIAIPELRTQAQAIARRILEALRNGAR